MITDINDYIPRLQELFPTVPKKDIKRIVEYGWRMFYFYNLRGCDTLLKSNKYKYWMYCGQLQNDPVKHYHYYRLMLRRKLRSLYAKKKVQWDGYYYTFISEEEYSKYFNRKGRKRKHFTLNNKVAFKIFDEAKLFYNSAKYIAKFRYITDMGYSFFKKEFECSNLEIVLIRDRPDTFKDIMISMNNYELL